MHGALLPHSPRSRRRRVAPRRRTARGARRAAARRALRALLLQADAVLVRAGEVGLEAPLPRGLRPARLLVLGAQRSQHAVLLLQHLEVLPIRGVHLPSPASYRLHPASGERGPARSVSHAQEKRQGERGRGVQAHPVVCKRLIPPFCLSKRRDYSRSIPCLSARYAVPLPLHFPSRVHRRPPVPAGTARILTAASRRIVDPAWEINETLNSSNPRAAPQAHSGCA